MPIKSDVLAEVSLRPFPVDSFKNGEEIGQHFDIVLR